MKTCEKYNIDDDSQGLTFSGYGLENPEGT